jgi:rubrerythrin
MSEVERLREQRDYWKALAKSWGDEKDRLEDEVERLREALRKIRDGAFDGQHGEWWYRLATDALKDRTHCEPHKQRLKEMVHRQSSEIGRLEDEVEKLREALQEERRMKTLVCKSCGGEWDQETTSCKVCGGQQATTALPTSEVERLREALQRIEAGLVEYVENGAECTMDPQDVLEIVRHALVTPGGNHGGTDA